MVMGFGTPPAPPAVTKHTELTDKEVAGVIDHADLSVTDEKLASGVGLSDGQICKLPTATPDQVLKRGATAWEAGDVPPPVLEGDYSDWAIYDSFDDPHVYDDRWAQEAVVNKEETEIVLIDAVNVRVKRYTIATKTLSDAIITGQWWSPTAEGLGTMQRSVQQTYIVVMWATAGPYYNCNRLSIIKNGVVVKTLTNSDLGFGTNFIRSVSISRSGKYIIASGVRAATGNPGWVVLEGS
jgi:hypothetical protein